ncbi:MAG: hypothetical protein JW724_05945 [Candidatus Altiarchaeota archaeon]|nr:hypothetical protein [Candidatus Altiarchaeota archaeon]
METLRRLSKECCDASLKLMFSPKVATAAGIALIAGGVVLVGANIASAISAPATGSFAYDIYDIAVNDMMKGPIGYIAGLGAMVLGAFAAIQQKLGLAACSILGGGALIKADAITQSLGLMF